jgi:hypothetical protein
MAELTAIYRISEFLKTKSKGYEFTTYSMAEDFNLSINEGDRVSQNVVAAAISTIYLRYAGSLTRERSSKEHNMRIYSVVDMSIVSITPKKAPHGRKYGKRVRTDFRRKPDTNDVRSLLTSIPTEDLVEELRRRRKEEFPSHKNSPPPTN